MQCALGEHPQSLRIPDLCIRANNNAPIQVGYIAILPRMAGGLIFAASSVVQEKSVKKGRLFERSEFLPFRRE